MLIDISRSSQKEQILHINKEHAFQLPEIKSSWLSNRQNKKKIGSAVLLPVAERNLAKSYGKCLQTKTIQSEVQGEIIAFIHCNSFKTSGLLLQKLVSIFENYIFLNGLLISERFLF
jgi:hypothetical protein